MLHYVLQLVTNCLLFGAEQVVCSGFLRDVFVEAAAVEKDAMRAVRVNQNIKVVGLKTKTMSGGRRNSYRELKGTAEFGDKFPSSLQATAFTLHIVMWLTGDKDI